MTISGRQQLEHLQWAVTVSQTLLQAPAEPSKHYPNFWASVVAPVDMILAKAPGSESNLRARHAAEYTCADDAVGTASVAPSANMDPRIKLDMLC
jgi:hypothetical protein